MSFVPKMDYLARVERGEIKMYYGPSASSPEWCLSADGGLFQLRKYEEAGLIRPLVTAKWAGYPFGQRGTPARLTDKGKALLQDQ